MGIVSHESPAALVVVVLSVGAPPELHAALTSLAGQDVPLEVVVVNSGGGDIDGLRRNSDPAIHIVDVKQTLWPGAARNVGVRESRAPVVAFIASDHIVTPGWCAARLRRHASGAEAVACAVINSHPRNVVAWAHHIAILFRRLPGIPMADALPYGASYTRTLLERLGPFREDLRIGEDTEFNGRIGRPGEPVWAPEVQTIHRNTTRIGELIRDQYARGWRSGFHWSDGTPAKGLVRPVVIRFREMARLSIRSTLGTDRLYVVASLPLVLLTTVVHRVGLLRGYRERQSQRRTEVPTL
jgi:GT2 family glycosyltransferase